MRQLALGLFALSVIVGGGPALAQGWPAKPIPMVVPFAPGPLDIVARWVAPKLSEALGQPVVVEHRPGAKGMIGSSAVARAAPDAHTILAATVGTHVTSVHLLRNLAYDPVNDFTPIAAAVEPVTCLVVNSALPVHSVEGPMPRPGPASCPTARPDEFRALIRDGIERFGAIIKAAGIEPQ